MKWIKKINWLNLATWLVIFLISCLIWSWILSNIQRYVYLINIYPKIKAKYMSLNMDYIDKYDDLVKILTESIEIDGKKYNLKEDFEKFFIRGNKSAGVRIRKVMQEIKNMTSEVRKDVQNYKSKV